MTRNIPRFVHRQVAGHLSMNGRAELARDPATTPMSLPEIQTMQREFLAALEDKMKREHNADIDIFAIAEEVDIVPVLAIEFLYYWVDKGRLHPDWTEVAARKREELAGAPLRPPPGMIAKEPERGRQ